MLAILETLPIGNSSRSLTAGLFFELALPHFGAMLPAFWTILETSFLSLSSVGNARGGPIAVQRMSLVFKNLVLQRCWFPPDVLFHRIDEFIYRK